MLRSIMSLALVAIGAMGANASELPVDTEQIQQWIEQLDSPQYAEREEATKKLIEVGHKLAMLEVSRTVEYGSPESRTRATHILAMWHRSSDATARQVVQAAAARWQASKDPRMARLGKTIVTRPVPIVANPVNPYLWHTRSFVPAGAMPAMALPAARGVPLRIR